MNHELPSELAELIRLSHAAGADPDWVQGGGGNTSVKSADGRFIWVKTSGSPLADMNATRGWARLDLGATLAILDAPGLASKPAHQREEEVLQLLRAAKLEPADVRPSVESSLHALLDRVVVHTHPVHLTAFLASRNSRDKWHDVLGAIDTEGIALYVPYVDPGYTLAAKLRADIEAFARAKGRRPRVVLLENHGLFVAADSVDDCLALHQRVADAGKKWGGGRRVNPLKFHFVRDDAAEGEPDYPTCSNDVAAFASATFSGMPRHDAADAERVAAPFALTRVRTALIEGGAQPVLVRQDDAPIALELLNDEAALRAAEQGAFTPDQIVYCKTWPAFFAPSSSSTSDPTPRWSAAVRAYRERTGLDPRVIVVPGLGVFHCAPDLAQLRVVAETHRLAMTALLRSNKAGGPRFLDRRQAGFIEEWEVEKFRAALLRGSGRRFEGRVALIVSPDDDAAIPLLNGGATLFVALAAETPLPSPPTSVPAGRWLALHVDAASRVSCERALRIIIASVGGLDLLVEPSGRASVLRDVASRAGANVVTRLVEWAVGRGE